MVLSAVSVYSHEDNGPIISFEENKFSFDTIARNSNGEHNFFFVNAGSEPLLITSAFSSCGCVVPEFPKQPILPGEKSSIKVKYNTNNIGGFNKTITVPSNAVNDPRVVLRIKGTVLKPESTPTDNQ